MAITEMCYIRQGHRNYIFFVALNLVRWQICSIKLLADRPNHKIEVLKRKLYNVIEKFQ